MDYVRCTWVLVWTTWTMLGAHGHLCSTWTMLGAHGHLCSTWTMLAAHGHV